MGRGSLWDSEDQITGANPSLATNRLQDLGQATSPSGAPLPQLSEEGI